MTPDMLNSSDETLYEMINPRVRVSYDLDDWHGWLATLEYRVVYRSMLGQLNSKWVGVVGTFVDDDDILNGNAFAALMAERKQRKEIKREQREFHKKVNLKFGLKGGLDAR